MWLVRGYHYFVGINFFDFPSIILHEVVLTKAEESQVSNCSKYLKNVKHLKKRIGQNKVMSISQYSYCCYGRMVKMLCCYGKIIMLCCYGKIVVSLSLARLSKMLLKRPRLLDIIQR